MHRALTSGDIAVPVQRLVMVGKRVYSNDPKQRAHQRTAESLWNSVVAVGERRTDSAREEFETHREQMRRQLDKWVDDRGVGALSPDPATAKSHPLGRKQQSRSYINAEELYEGLLGWVKQKPGRHEERQWAEQVQKSSDIDRHLDALLVKIGRWLDEHPDLLNDPGRRVAVLRELRTSRAYDEHGRPRHLGTYRVNTAKMARQGRGPATRIGTDMMAVIKRPEKYSQMDKLAVLHDLQEYLTRPRSLETAGSNLLGAPGRNRTQHTSEIDPATGRRTAATSSRGVRHPRLDGGILPTRVENDPTTRLARQHNVPVWAGSSNRAARMLHLGAEAGGTSRELGAMAWALFAFWRINYDHTSKMAYHTLHETLDMASNFGVEYNMLDRSAGLEDYRPGKLLGEMRETIAALRGDLAGLGEAVKQHDLTAAGVSSKLAARYHVLRAKVDAAAQGTGWMFLSDAEERAVARRNAALTLQEALTEYTWLCEDLARSPAVADPEWARKPPPDEP